MLKKWKTTSQRGWIGSILLSLLLVGSLAVVGCSDDDDDDDNGTTTGPTTGTIATIASEDTSLSLLNSALTAAELDSTLDNEAGPFTVFAPSNQAFEALPAGVLDALLADPRGDLRTILRYHIVRDEIAADTLTTLNTITSALGEDIQVSTGNGNVLLNDSIRVVITDIEASNGIIHVIDGVLTPPTLGQ
jgi:uncharacterized surface protein with fasciclin (FAS1) repeats